MKTKHLFQTAAFAVVSAFSLQPSALVYASPLGTAFTYQGKLADGGNPANGSYDLKFTLYGALHGGGGVGGPLTNTAVAISNGLFTVALDFGGNPFTGDARWLEIGARTNGAAVDFTVLTPRQPLTPSPYALYAPSAGVAATATVANSTASNSVNTASLQATSVTTDKIADGTITDADISVGGISGSKIVGGDLQALRLKVGQNHTLSGNLATIAGGQSNQANAYLSAIGGGEQNSIWADADHATIAGGSANAVQSLAGLSAIGGGYGNTIQTNAYLSAISGGYGNTIRSNANLSVIGGGANNIIWANSDHSAIAGGLDNAIQSSAGSSAIAGGAGNTVQTNAYLSAIGGGYHNTIRSNASVSVIGGGAYNIIQPGAHHSFIGGGSDNIIAGNVATIPGGANNSAAGTYSFAAGYRAKANHYGSFVWGDYTEADVASTANNQFVVRATGGVRFDTGGLEVNGSIKTSGGLGNAFFKMPADSGYEWWNGGFTDSAGSWQIVHRRVSDGAWTAPFTILSSGNVGIGTATPTAALHLAVPGSSSPIEALNVDVASFTTDTNATASHFLRIRDVGAGGVKLIVKGNGNVGIGTASPAKALEVRAEVLIKGNDDGGTEYNDWPYSSLSIRRSDNFVANGVTMVSLGYRNDPLYASDDSVANIRLWDPSQPLNAATSTNTTQLRIASPGPLVLQTSGGKVGIGTASPEATLDVAGTVKATGFTGAGAGLTGLGDANISSLSGSKIVGGDLQATRLNVGQSHTLSGTLATIAGGSGNYASGDYATIAGGGSNQATNSYSTVGGGHVNLAFGADSVVAGGLANTASGPGAFVGGGQGVRHVVFPGWHYHGNTASGTNSVVVGGNQNQASGAYSAVPGGSFNTASGTYSFAAGYGADAIHQGSFVWGDSHSQVDTGSTGPDQFVIRAVGAVRLVGGTELMWGSSGQSTLTSDQGGSIELGDSTLGGTTPHIDFHYGMGVAEDYNVRLINDAPGVLSCYGRFQTCTLTITGGCDISEPFAVSSKDIPKGAVVVIDEKNPGALKLSDTPYDKRVAGVVSGANGVNPGLTLSQKGVLDGEQQVALTGRVYVLADAAHAPIEPGDLLTTSVTPGHAMKVTDHSQAQGAIFGKAMSPLKSGRGMVLVLVSLQ